MSYDAVGFRSYREIRKLLGNPITRKARKPDTRTGDRHKTKRLRGEDFRQLEFLAWDGEGIGHPRNRYVMLSNSQRDCLRGRDLTSEEIFEFLLEHRGGRRTVHCVYGGVYDFTHWILSLPDENKRQLHETGSTTWKQYTLQYTPRKSFKLEDRSKWVPRHKGESAKEWYKRNRKNRRDIIVWDVIGFFQSSFLSAIVKWGIGTVKQQKLISEMKLSRGDFADDAQASILEYNFLECELLAALMQKLHALLLQNPIDPTDNNVWLSLKRWDGAGAVAAAIYRKEGIKEHVGSSVSTDFHGRPVDNWHYRDKQEQSDIEYALRCAYFGGRIECFQRGHAHRAGYDIDIVSAYPAAMLTLPSFQAGGRWEWEEKFDEESFGVWRTEWDSEAHAIYPLPYRTHTGGVLFPDQGRGWYHTVEVAAALEDKRNHVTVHGGYVWRPSTDVKPFAFVSCYFDARRALQAIGHAAEKVIKLGINSLYGKTAQTLGSELEDFPCGGRGIEQCRTDTYVEDCAMDKIFSRTPPFFNLAWAGAITAHCRATVYRECMPRENEIVMIQTDGMFGVGAAPDYPKTGALGSFDVVPYDDVIVVQAGVYYLGTWDEESGEISWGISKSRGFHSDEVDIDEILKAWKSGQVLELTYQSRPRFQTLGFSVSKGDFSVLACWRAQPRKLNLYVDSKRSSLVGLTESVKNPPTKELKRLQLHKRIRPTYGLINTDFFAGCPSRPTDPKWKQKLHATGEDDFALSEPLVEGSDFVDNFVAELQAKFGF